jgi:hypothetical protein
MSDQIFFDLTMDRSVEESYSSNNNLAKSSLLSHGVTPSTVADIESMKMQSSVTETQPDSNIRQRF